MGLPPLRKANQCVSTPLRGVFYRLERNNIVEAITLFESARQLSAHLRMLRKDLRKRKLEVRARGQRRMSLSAIQRRDVLNKSGGRCHICGGGIDGTWDADHVFAYAQGGAHGPDNYLPAHSICNSYRWFYGAEEFQWILKLGVWLRTQIANEEHSALRLAERFVRHERSRDSRRKKKQKK